MVIYEATIAHHDEDDTTDYENVTDVEVSNGTLVVRFTDGSIYFAAAGVWKTILVNRVATEMIERTKDKKDGL